MLQLPLAPASLKYSLFRHFSYEKKKDIGFYGRRREEIEKVNGAYCLEAETGTFMKRCLENDERDREGEV